MDISGRPVVRGLERGAGVVDGGAEGVASKNELRQLLRRFKEDVSF